MRKGKEASIRGCSVPCPREGDWIVTSSRGLSRAVNLGMKKNAKEKRRRGEGGTDERGAKKEKSSREKIVRKRTNGSPLKKEQAISGGQLKRGSRGRRKGFEKRGQQKICKCPKEGLEKKRCSMFTTAARRSGLNQRWDERLELERKKIKGKKKRGSHTSERI